MGFLEFQGLVSHDLLIHPEAPIAIIKEYKAIRENLTHLGSQN